MARRVSRNIATNGRIPVQQDILGGDGSSKIVVSNGKAATLPSSTRATYVTRNYVKMHQFSEGGGGGGGGGNGGESTGQSDDGGNDGDDNDDNALAIAPSHARVQSALHSIGAKPLQDYVETLQLTRKRQDEEDRIDQRREQQRRKGIPATEAPYAQPRTSAPRQPKTKRASEPSASDADRLLQLPFMPSSRLGKTLSRSSTGHIREVFNIHHGRSYVAQLNELLQAIGCELATYDTSSQFQSRYKTSPEFFATVVVHTFCFVDNQGKRSIKAGRECVAKMALEYFMPWCAVDEGQRYLSGSAGVAIDGERFSEID